MLRRTLMTLAAASALAVGFASTAMAGTLEDIQARGKLLVAIDIAHSPYGMLDAGGNRIGSDVETAQLLADDLGVPLEIVPASGSNRIPFLISNKVDVVIASFSITDERKKVIDFSKPYGVVPVVVAAPKSDSIASAKDMDGMEVAVARGATADIEVTRVVKEAGSDVDIKRYEDEATATTAVATGQQKVFAAALSTAQALIEDRPALDMEVKFEMNAYPMGIGLRKGDDPFKARIDEFVTTNLHNGKLNGIYKKYFKQDLPAEMLQ